MTGWGSGRVCRGEVSRPIAVQPHPQALLGIANDWRVVRACRAGATTPSKSRTSPPGFVLLPADVPYAVHLLVLVLLPEHYLLRARDGTARYRFCIVLRLGFKMLLYRLLLPAWITSPLKRADANRYRRGGHTGERMTAVPMGVPVEVCGPSLRGALTARAHVPQFCIWITRQGPPAGFYDPCSPGFDVGTGGAALHRRPGRRSDG